MVSNNKCLTEYITIVDPTTGGALEQKQKRQDDIKITLRSI